MFTIFGMNRADRQIKESVSVEISGPGNRAISEMVAGVRADDHRRTEVVARDFRQLPDGRAGPQLGAAVNEIDHAVEQPVEATSVG